MKTLPKGAYVRDARNRRLRIVSYEGGFFYRCRSASGEEVVLGREAFVVEGQHKGKKL